MQINKKKGPWIANVTVTDDFDFTDFKNPLKQGSVIKGALWTVNNVAYYDQKWGLLDPVGVEITYSKEY